MKNLLLIPELKELISRQDSQALKEFGETNHPAIVAELIAGLSPEEIVFVLRQINLQKRAEIFSHLDEDSQIKIIDVLQRDEIVQILTEMSPDDRADLFKGLAEEKREILWPALAQAEREDIRRLTSYREGTAGAVMTSDYATISPEMTSSQAIEHLRKIAPDKETIYYSYVVDRRRRLIGFVSLKDLILAPRTVQVKEIMHRDVIFVRVEDDQEKAALLIQKYDLLALPVVNGNNVLVGIITYDDAMDVLTQEQTEDMEKFMAITGSHEVAVYMRTSAWDQFKNRAPWVVILALLGFISGAVVQKFEMLLMNFTILAAFMPMLADTGGNTGSQSATMIVRALALQEIRPKNLLRVLYKESQIAILLGILLGMIAYGRFLLVAGSYQGEGVPLGKIGIAVALALCFQVITATLIGAILPLGAALFHFDPAVVASPALTTIVDITGLLIYFSTVKIFIGL